MTHQHRLQLAITCLRELQEASGALTAGDISRRQHLSVRDCEWAIDRLAAAGLVELNGNGAAALSHPEAELSSLEVLQAVWDNPRPGLLTEWLYGPSSGIPTGWLGSDYGREMAWEEN